MCGLVGILSYAAPVSRQQLLAGMGALRHRGPDGQGSWFSPRGDVALGHTQLHIMDALTGQQPMLSQDGQIALIANGEFYGTGPLRAKLERRGYRFHSRSDSEVALHLYQAYGLGFVQHLRGEFALILWDGTRQQLVAVRDRFGIKPLCYAPTPQGLYLASEAKAILAAGVPAAWDHPSLFQVLQMQYLLPEQTLFAGISQLPPGHILLARGRDLQILKYWDLDYPPATEPSPGADWQEIVREGLVEAVQMRLKAESPVCFYLSGGLDSSAVAGIASQYQRDPLTCFMASFEDPDYDESQVARASAAYLGAQLHSLPLTSTQLAQELPQAVYAGETLAINSHVAAKRLVARQMRRQGFKVALTGEGADEVFSGYAHFQQDMGETSANPLLAGIHLPYGPGLPLTAVQQTLGFVPAFLAAKASLGYRLQTLMDADFQARFAGMDPFCQLMESIDGSQLQGRHRLNQSTYLWSKLALANYILRAVGDGAEMSVGLEGRLPFLDHKLFERLRALPPSLRIRQGQAKYILRQAVGPFVTPLIQARPKQSFMAPPLAETLGETLLAEIPFFSRPKIQAVLRALPAMPPAERCAWEPALLMVASVGWLQQSFRLGS